MQRMPEDPFIAAQPDHEGGLFSFNTKLRASIVGDGDAWAWASPRIYCGETPK
jgi:hypothetical protein